MPRGVYAVPVHRIFSLEEWTAIHREQEYFDECKDCGAIGVELQLPCLSAFLEAHVGKVVDISSIVDLEYCTFKGLLVRVTSTSFDRFFVQSYKGPQVTVTHHHISTRIIEDPSYKEREETEFVEAALSGKLQHLLPLPEPLVDIILERV